MPTSGALLALLVATAPQSDPSSSSPWDARPFMEAPAAEVLQAANGHRKPGEDRSLIRWESLYTIDPDGRATLTGREVFALWTDRAVRELGQVGQGWATWHQERPTVRARVITPDGEVHVLDPATLSEVPLREQDGDVSDQRAIAGPLPAIVRGAVVELEFTRQDREPLLAGGMMAVLPIRGEDVETVVRVEVPERVPLRWVVQELDVRPRDTRSGGIRTVEWRWTTPDETRDQEELEPGRWDWGPLLAFSTVPSWSAVATAYTRLSERQLEGAVLGGLAKEIAGKARTREEAAVAILEWMRTKLRYTALSLGAHAIVPARPDEVMTRRYGDCKDLSLLFVGLMRALGHGAHLALVRASTSSDVDPDLPGLQGFDHAIVRLEGATPLYIDPTFPWPRPGELMPWLEGRLALVVRERQDRLERMPVANATAYASDLEREVVMDDDGADVVRERRKLRGIMAAITRAGRPTDPVQAEKDDLAEMEKRLQSKEVTTRFSEASDGSVEQLTEAKNSKLVSWSGADEVSARVEHRMLACIPDALRDREGKPRTRPLDVILPCVGELRHVLDPPPGFHPVEPLPAGVRIEAGGFRYATRYDRRPDGAVTAWAGITLLHGRLSPEQVNALRAELGKLDAAVPVVKFERRSAKLLAAGRGGEALEELRAVAAASHRPQDQIRLAYGLSDLGMNDAAVRVARDAASAAPDLFFTQAGLATVLARDPIGRHLERGCDHRGAVAAQRKAVALLKGEVRRGHGWLGWLLLHGDDCRILADGAAPEEGVALLEKTVKAGIPGYSDELLFGYLATGRHADALELARTLDDGAAWRTGGLLAALVRTEGVAAAAAEAAGFAPDARTRALRAGARRLALRRDFALGADLLEKGSAGAQDRQGLLELAATLRRAEAISRAPAGSPQRAAVRWLVKPSGDAAMLAAPGRPTRQELTWQTEVRALERDLPTAVAAELEVASWDSSFTEAGGVGRLASRAGPSVYLAREGGAWRILALGDELPQVAYHTLRALAGGDAERGRVLAGWLREDAVSPEGADEDHPSQVVERLGAEGRERPQLLAGALAAVAAPGDALAVLEPAARGPLSSRAGRVVRLAVARARLANGEPGAALALLDTLLAEEPDATAVQAARIEALVALGRAGDALALLRGADRLDVPASRLRRLTSAASAAGLQAAIVPHLETLAGGAPSALDLNNLAWARLFARPVPPAALSEAQRAADRDAGYSVKHTLASALAAAGEPVQAVRVLREAVGQTGGVRVEDWVVIGLVAEALGLNQDAVAAYRRVQAEVRSPADGVLGLAAGRLQALAPGAEKPGAAAP